MFDSLNVDMILMNVIDRINSQLMPSRTVQLNTVNPEFFARVLLSRIALKDKLTRL